MSNPNIPLETAVKHLPFGWTWRFNWEHDGVTYEYRLRTKSMYYRSEKLDVRGDVLLTKYRLRNVPFGWGDFKLRIPCWSIESRCYADLLDPRDIASELVPVAAKIGVVLSETLLRRCATTIDQAVRPIRTAALAAVEHARESAHIRAA